MYSSSSSSSINFFDDFLEDITRCLTKDESKQQQIRDNMKAKSMAEDSIRIYNQCQDQLYCHPSSESHPDCWRISLPTDCENKGCARHCYSSSSSSSTTSSLSNLGKKRILKAKDHLKPLSSLLQSVGHFSQSPSRELFAPPTVKLI